MKKANLTKKLSLNKVTIAGLDANNKAGIRGGDLSIKYGCNAGTTKGYYVSYFGTCYNTCRNGCGSIYPVTSEPTDPTYTC
ncbi:MAG: hypothetical protein GY765_34445 [bacterium]|nr:hypothetical protein [bacterium]